jgi:hypothetical protein
MASSTIGDFIDTLVFDPADMPFVNKQVILGSLWWVDKVPNGQTPTKPYSVWDPRTETLIQWNLNDLNQMVQKVAKKNTNGSVAIVTIGSMIPSSSTETYLESAFVDPPLGNVMLQYWAYGEVRY